jgi:hypothetical protein
MFLFPHQKLVETSVTELGQSPHGQSWRILSCHWQVWAMPPDHHQMWLMISFCLIHLALGLKIERKYSSQLSSWPHCDTGSLSCCCYSKLLMSVSVLQSLLQWNTCYTKKLRTKIKPLPSCIITMKSENLFLVDN